MEAKNHELDVLKESRLYKAYIDNHRGNVKTAYDVNGVAIGKALGLSIAAMKELNRLNLKDIGNISIRLRARLRIRKNLILPGNIITRIIGIISKLGL